MLLFSILAFLSIRYGENLCREDSMTSVGTVVRAGAIVFVVAISSVLAADNLEKTQKRELESQAKAIIAEAKSLEQSGQLANARAKYAESQAMIEMKEAAEAIKHLDDEIHK